MNFCIIRLGKDSVLDIRRIDSTPSFNGQTFNINVSCKQVPNDVQQGTFCIIWLGSDNNKGVSTSWEQGIRAFGKIISKRGGPNYNDEWNVQLEIGFILDKSVKKIDILSVNSESYVLSSNIPVIGLNTSSNQTIQLIKPDEPRQDINALFYCLNAVDNSFYKLLDRTYPELGDYTIFNPPLNVFSYTNDNEDYIENEHLDYELGRVVTSKSFDPSLINIDNRLISIDLIIGRLRMSPPEIDLYPDFQRNEDLWDKTKQSRLIESILIRFPLPAFYFDGSDKNNWLVVDGLQRLSSIRNFMLTKTLILTNLEFLSQLNGLGYDDLDRNLQRQIEETQIIAYVINPGTPDDVKFNIFKRINTGGLVLTAQEIRHALYQGKPSRFIAYLADSIQFKEATNYIKTQRMLDRDFVNRFIAFYLLGYQNYTPDLDTFMSKAMAMINNLTDDVLNDCETAFLRSMELNSRIFQTNAFRRIDRNSVRRKPLNKALFDVFSVLFAMLDVQSVEILLSHQKQFVHSFINLLEEDQMFQASISSSTSDRGRVLYRFNKISELIYRLINQQE